MPRFPIACSVLLSAGFTACVGAPAPAPTSEARAQIVIGTSLTIDSAVLGQARTLNVYLPWGYAERDESFPVLYLIDGGLEQDFLPVAGFAALASLSAQYGEFILVGVQTDERRFELTTPSTLPGDLELIPHNGGADDFRRFLLQEVRPFIEQRYRTSGETLVLGESLAGLFIVDTFLRAPDSFDHYIAVSPSLWWHDRSLARAASGWLQADDFPAGRSLYLSAADETDILAGLELLVPALEAHAPEQLTWWYQPMPDEHHHTIYHPATLRALRLILGAGGER